MVTLTDEMLGNTHLIGIRSPFHKVINCSIDKSTKSAINQCLRSKDTFGYTHVQIVPSNSPEHKQKLLELEMICLLLK